MLRRGKTGCDPDGKWERSFALRGGFRKIECGGHQKPESSGMPSWELFERRMGLTRRSVLPASVTARVSVEMASVFGWERYTGTKGKIIGMRSFGASSPLKDLLRNSASNRTRLWQQPEKSSESEPANETRTWLGPCGVSIEGRDGRRVAFAGA